MTIAFIRNRLHYRDYSILQSVDRTLACTRLHAANVLSEFLTSVGFNMQPGTRTATSGFVMGSLLPYGGQFPRNSLKPKTSVGAF